MEECWNEYKYLYVVWVLFFLLISLNNKFLWGKIENIYEWVYCKTYMLQINDFIKFKKMGCYKLIFIK